MSVSSRHGVSSGGPARRRGPLGPAAALIIIESWVMMIVTIAFGGSGKSLAWHDPPLTRGQYGSSGSLAGLST